jgi:uracil phosphoribosyltransferase
VRKAPALPRFPGLHDLRSVKSDPFGPTETATRRLTHVTHPLVQHKLSYLRDKDTPTVHFRKLVNEVTLLLTYEATKDFPTEEVEIDTPLEAARIPRLAGKKVAVCPVLRAGVGMLDGVLSLISSARVGFIGMYRDEETLQPVQYYSKLPTDLSDRDAIVLDPMLATGHSSAAAIDAVKEAGAQTVTLVCIVAAPPGIEFIQEKHPDVHIVCAAVDRALDERGFIVPGLGDAGDRLYGTK